MEKSSVRQQAVRRAAEILGGPQKLARRLHVPMSELLSWMNGKVPPSNTAFLQCVDLILENEDSIDGALLRDAAGASSKSKGHD